MTFIGDPNVCDYADFLVSQDAEDQFYPMLLDYLDEEEWQELKLFSLPQESPTLTKLPGLARERGHQVHVEEEDVAPGVVLPDTWDEYLGDTEQEGPARAPTQDAKAGVLRSGLWLVRAHRLAGSEIIPGRFLSSDEKEQGREKHVSHWAERELLPLHGNKSFACRLVETLLPGVGRQEGGRGSVLRLRFQAFPVQQRSGPPITSTTALDCCCMPYVSGMPSRVAGPTSTFCGDRNPTSTIWVGRTGLSTAWW